MDKIAVKYPVGIQTFDKIREGGYLYIDKTDYIYNIAHTYQYVFLSRPRRFGKSLLTSTFEAYFAGRKELFQGLAIDQMERDWEQYPVLHFDLSDVKDGTVAGFLGSIDSQMEAYEVHYGVPKSTDNPAVRLKELVINISQKTGMKVVVLIDEYDAPMLTVLHDEKREEPMRTAMQSFYSPLKKLDPYLKFVFITGITKFSQLSIFSQLNNLEVITMKPPFAAVCGITQQELEDNFAQGIQAMQDDYGMTRDEVLAKLKLKYDGYHFSHRGPGVYNPFSLLSAMKNCDFDNYWFASGTPTFLVEQVRYFGADVTQIDGQRATAGEFDAPTENMHSILPLFYQSGYLTIKDYDPEVMEYTLGYPNEEVKVGMMQMFMPYYVEVPFAQSRSAARDIYLAMRDGDIDRALTVARDFFLTVPYQEGTLKNAPTTEGHFTAMLYVMFSFLNFYTLSQVRVAAGRMDIVVHTKSNIYVMELKIDGSADEALKQIDDKGYAIAWQADGRQVVKVGINFSIEQRTIAEWKVG